ncbi:hypothetical protein QBZ16_002016 [Prototheca wickerhamii]|uniref:Uncharacterized protein n=1 Tax=Prototheca wickerhamii TaxID=3111 RepID=A0AAD9MNU8_PROWI|nr:hypothetical protein QBZ16_002016 [Prototheca wickerhamii]
MDALSSDLMQSGQPRPSVVRETGLTFGERVLVDFVVGDAIRRGLRDLSQSTQAELQRMSNTELGSTYLQEKRILQDLVDACDQQQAAQHDVEKAEKDIMAYLEELMQGLYELQVFRPGHFDRKNMEEYGDSFVPVPSMSQWRSIATRMSLGPRQVAQLKVLASELFPALQRLMLQRRDALLRAQRMPLPVPAKALGLEGSRESVEFLKTVGNLEATLKYEQGLYRGLCQVFLMQILQPSQMAKAMLESRWLITDVIMLMDAMLEVYGVNEHTTAGGCLGA